MSIIIDEEFRQLIPPLTAEEYTQLEKNIVKDGIRDALIVWPQKDGNDILIDGHNRMAISAAHGGIQFQIKRKEFKDREEAKRWIILNQFGRRNLSAYDRSLLALKLKPLIVEKAKERMSDGGKGKQISADLKGQSRDELAKVAGVSHDTIHKVEVINTRGSEEIKQAVRSGELSINKAYNTITSPSKSPSQIKKEEQQKIRDRRMEFEEKKESGVVDFSDIKQEQSDRQSESEELWRRCMNIGRSIDEIKNGCEIGKYNMSEMANDISENDRVSLLRNLRYWKKLLEEFISEVEI